MKNLKQILSVVLVLLLALSTVAFAVSAEEFVPSEEPIIYFEVPDDWNNVSSIFCHIWPYGGDPFANWQSKKERCTETETEGVYSYDITAKLNTTLEEDVTYCIIFSANTGMQTYDLLFSTECFGDTAYCDGTTYENPEDSSKTAQAAFWKHQDSFVYGPVLSITSIGNVTGTALPPNATASDIFYSFLTGPKLESARTYSGKTDQKIIDDLAPILRLSNEDVAEIITLAGIAVDWEADRASSGDEASRDEFCTHDEMLIYGDANLDGDINIKDATLIQKVVAGLEDFYCLHASWCADVNRDLDVNIKDATAIQKYVANLETEIYIGAYLNWDSVPEEPLS